jgi:uroporphyrinogen decarboxylase
VAPTTQPAPGSAGSPSRLPEEPRGASRARVLTALAHREPDRIPFDLGGSRVTGLHVRAYPALREVLGLPPVEVRVGDLTQQLADVDRDVMDALGCDVRLVGPGSPSGYRRVMADDGEYVTFRDEWGVGRRMPSDGGLYFDSYRAPLAGDPDDAAIDAFAWPDPLDAGRYAGMADRARRIVAEEGRAIHVGSICGGLTEGLFKLRGFEDGYMDLAAEPARARRVMERILEVKLAYWAKALDELGDLPDVVGEADDLGGQDRTLFSPATYRSLVKPLQRELFAFLRARTQARIFFHSCGAIRELIPDLIEIGVDIINPVQVSAAGMDGAELKREFGRDLVFWGGGVDTQRVLGGASPGEVREDVRRRIDALRGDGGFVFAAVHNVQPNVPAANLLAMWEAWLEAGTAG